MSRLICGLLLVVCVLIGCAATPAVPPRPALINHVVFFKLKSPATAEELIADCDEHPTHIRIESKWRPRLQWMRVHDTIDRTR